MLKRVLATLVLLTLLVIGNGAALAFNTRITVYASVPEMRVIYVDKSGNITKVEGNTTKNIDPKVLDENSQPVNTTGAISQQYQNFLSQHGGHLEASKIYIVNPVSINTRPNQQTIKVEANSAQLSLTL